MPLPLSLESRKRPCGPDDPRGSSSQPLKEVCRCPDGRRCSVYGSRCHAAPERCRAVILRENVSARKGDPRSPCPDTVQDESWTRPKTLSAASPFQRSSESSSQSSLQLRESRVSPRERSGSFSASDQGTI